MKKLIAISAATLMLPLLAQTQIAQAASLDKEQQQQVKQLVRETLMENPEILVDVINELKKKEEAARNAAQSTALKESHKELFNNTNDPYAGAEAKKAKLSLVYFGDINCGYCKKQDPILDNLVKAYPDVRIIYKDLPILSQSSREGAALALAAGKKGNNAYHALHSRLMTFPGRHDSDTIAAAVKAEGLDMDKLKKSVDATINEQLDSNLRLAQKLGIRGTPALVFTDQIVGGFSDEAALKAMVEERLKKTGKK